MDLVSHALELMRGSPEYTADARAGAAVGNTVIGSVMNLTTGAPRQLTEEAVRKALRKLDAERRTRKR
jgi:hypothetical protein